MDIPPRLSDRQQFILACLADGKLSATALSYRVARGFGGIHDRQQSLEEAEPAMAQLMRAILPSLDNSEVLTATHRASFSRSVRRLSERELVNRLYRAYKLERGDNPNMSTVEPTEQGEAVGREIQRRHADGRYSLSFDTEPWE